MNSNIIVLDYKYRFFVRSFENNDCNNDWKNLKIFELTTRF